MGTKSREIIVLAVCHFYILLFVYAAANKILDFDNFQVQLGQSPLLSAFAGPVSYLVPLVEIFITLLLLFPKYRTLGLLTSFSLMIMFTAYIIIILKFSPFVPCSCGGILDELSWAQHLVFNIVFVVLGLIGILISRNRSDGHRWINGHVTIPSILLTSLGSIALMGSLFLLSEDMIHHRNNFIRRFPHHPAQLSHEADLNNYTYYIAGVDSSSIYVANSEAPLVMTVFDKALQKKHHYRIVLPENKFQFHTVRVAIVPPYFYVSDGTVPVIFRGNISDWKAALWMSGDAYFTHIQPITPNLTAIRAISGSTHENILGTINLARYPKVSLTDKLLVKQIDGDFDTDGMLLYNAQLQKIIYTYFYRNQYIVADTALVENFTGNTIDTTTRAKIKVAYIPSRNQHKIASPSLVVNKFTATYGKYLFLNAGLMGKYEPAEMWSLASIVDVYDLSKQTYVFSFYVNDIFDEKLADFRIYGNQFVGIIGRHIVTYEFQKNTLQLTVNGAGVPNTAQYQGYDRNPAKE